MNRTAIILRENISEIMKLWQDEVIKHVPAADEASTIALFEHLPNMITDISDLMSHYDEMDDITLNKYYSEILDNSILHGKQRATTSNYTVDQVVHEYIIFHRILREFIKANNGYDQKMTELLRFVIESSILKSVNSFSLSIQEMQEKLIGTLAHDIRNPLAAAQLSLEMIEQDKTGKWTERARISAQRSVKKAINLIEGLMNGIAVKAGEGMLLHFRETDLLKEINEVYVESIDTFSNEIRLESKLVNLWGIFDTIAIRRLLENLIGNAVKYGSSEKPISIMVEEETDLVTIKIHNHGNPIPMEKQERIFRFLGSAREDYKSISGSWGMGLTLAQIVAQAHGGDISLTSNEKTGTTFTVSLIRNFNEEGKRRARLNRIL